MNYDKDFCINEKCTNKNCYRYLDREESKDYIGSIYLSEFKDTKYCEGYEEETIAR